MDRYADNTKNSIGKNDFQHQTCSVNSQVFVYIPLEAALFLGLTEYKHSIYYVSEMLTHAG